MNKQEHIPAILLHRECKSAKLEARKIAHLRMFMFMQKHNELILNRRNICEPTRRMGTPRGIWC